MSEMTETSAPDAALSALKACKNARIYACLVGPAGSGKSHRLRLAAGSAQTVVLHLTDSFDAKSLLGSYTCGEVAGRFVWREGVLTRLMKSGGWLIIEDLESISADAAALLPKSGETEYLVHETNERIRIHEDFYISGTLRAVQSKSSCKLPSQLSSWLCISCDELESAFFAVNSKSGVGEEISSKLLSLFHLIAELPSSRRLSFHDYSRLLLRVSEVVKPGFLTENVRKFLAAECFACWAAHAHDVNVRRSAAELILSEWDISFALDSFLEERPGIHEDRDGLNLGGSFIRKSCLETAAVMRERTAAFTPHSKVHSRLLAQISRCITHRECPLLVGDAGCGKTASIQWLAAVLGKELNVYNFNDQTEAGDLLGSLRPVLNHKIDLKETTKKWRQLMNDSFSAKSNSALLAHVENLEISGNTNSILKALNGSVAKALAVDPARLPSMERWRSLSEEISRFSNKSPAFAFTQGILLTAAQQGSWLVLDEINLAPVDCLQAILPLLECLGEGSETCSMVVDGGEQISIKVHADFRLFACMNPPHLGRGKRALPEIVRCRFSEFFVDDTTDETDLLEIVTKGLEKSMAVVPAKEIVSFFLAVKNSIGLTEASSSGKPLFSLRILSRALGMARNLMASEKYSGSGVRALFESLRLYFAAPLDVRSESLVNDLLKSSFSASKELGMSSIPTSSSGYVRIELDKTKTWICIEGHWLKLGPLQIDIQATLSKFVATPSVLKTLKKIVCALSGGCSRPPLLLEGPTGAGKTSIVKFIAELTGHQFIRVNNHEHTDVQEYFGQYQPDPLNPGSLNFQEGVIVRAVRAGHWVVLDELNLAPSEVLEGLNRLLDDNREVFVPETGEVVRAHSDFALFATQNPAGAEYGGRKALSRAFRNRFLEIQVGELPKEELASILETRCSLPSSMSTSMLSVFSELSKRRRAESVFEGAAGAFAGVRDLLRWGGRKPGTHSELVTSGWFLLGERLRGSGEREELKRLLGKCCKGQLPEEGIEKGQLYGEMSAETLGTFGMVVTPTLCRVLTLLKNCIDNREAVLLVGETGTGKTTAIQLMHRLFTDSQINSDIGPMYIVNCHQHMEIGDLVGGMRPSRGRAVVIQQMQEMIAEFGASEITEKRPDKLLAIGEALAKHEESVENATTGEEAPVVGFSSKRLKMQTEEWLNNLRSLHKKAMQLFEWDDGPLVRAMREGGWVLLDEVNLAEDSVLERLNSVLDSDECALLLTEKADSERVVARGNFQVFCTMNPGGDFGKKELSPALRNRLTEIWVGSPDFLGEEGLGFLSGVLGGKSQIAVIAQEILKKLVLNCPGMLISQRDLVLFGECMQSEVVANIWERLAHGICMIFLDPLGSVRMAELLNLCVLPILITLSDISDIFGSDGFAWTTTGSCSIGSFPLPLHPSESSVRDVPWFAFDAPSSRRNFARVIRGMSVGLKPILLEGAPGAGKSALVAAIAQLCGHKITRVNLSDQTEISDLIGQDLPGESGFKWTDGVLLRAVRRGDWVLLDELNLAPQPVLEGLNALLDHRRELFIPELGETVKAGTNFRLFATQNGLDTAGRKGLPKSLLNRFVRVTVGSMEAEDCEFVCNRLFGGQSDSQLFSLIQRMEQVGVNLNMRDALRIASELNDPLPGIDPVQAAFVLIAAQGGDTDVIRKIFQDVFETIISKDVDPAFYLCAAEERLNQKIESKDQMVVNRLAILSGMSVQLSAACLALVRRTPILLTGPSGVGKTSLVSLLADLLGIPTPVTLHMHSQMDAGDLVGQFCQSEEGGLFEWRDSALVASLKRGDWLVLENADECPASVLDRLNALLETGGVLQVPERGSDEIIVPSEGWRVFLTGYSQKLSSAIRNRCTEIFVNNTLSAETISHLYDCIRILYVSGITDIDQLAIASSSFGDSCPRILSQFGSLYGMLDENTLARLLLRKEGMCLNKQIDFETVNKVIKCIVSGGNGQGMVARFRESHSQLLSETAVDWFLSSALNSDDVILRLGQVEELGLSKDLAKQSIISSVWDRLYSVTGRKSAVDLFLKVIPDSVSFAQSSFLDCLNQSLSSVVSGHSHHLDKSLELFSTLLKSSGLVNDDTMTCFMNCLIGHEIKIPTRPEHDALVITPAARFEEQLVLQKLIRDHGEALVEISRSVTCVVDLLATVCAGDRETLIKVSETISGLLDNRSEDSDESAKNVKMHISAILAVSGPSDCSSLLAAFERSGVFPGRLLEAFALLKQSEWNGKLYTAEQVQLATVLGRFFEEEISMFSLSGALKAVIEGLKGIGLGDVASCAKAATESSIVLKDWLLSSEWDIRVGEDLFNGITGNCGVWRDAISGDNTAIEEVGRLLREISRSEDSDKIVDLLISEFTGPKRSPALLALLSAWRLVSGGGWFSSSDEQEDRQILINILERKRQDLLISSASFSDCRMIAGSGAGSSEFDYSLAELEETILALKNGLCVRGVSEMAQSSTRTWLESIREKFHVFEGGCFAKYSDLKNRISDFSTQIVIPAVFGKPGNLKSSVVGFIKSLERDFPGFADLVQPVVLCASCFIWGIEGMARNIQSDLPLSMWSSNGLSLVGRVRWFGICRESASICHSPEIASLLFTELDSAVEQAEEKNLEISTTQNDVQFLVNQMIEETDDVEGEFKKVENMLFGEPDQETSIEASVSKSSLDELAAALIYAFGESRDDSGVQAVMKDALKSLGESDCQIPLLLNDLVAASKQATESVDSHEDIDEIIPGDSDTPLTEEQEALLEARRQREFRVTVSSLLSGKQKSLDFYSPGSSATSACLSALRRPVEEISRFLRDLDIKFPEHPGIENAQGICARLRKLCPGKAAPLSALEGAEILLDAVEGLRSAVPGISEESLMRLRSVIGNLRGLQIGSWKALRMATENRVSSEGSGRWFSLLWSAARSSSSTTDSQNTFEVVIRFLRTSPLGQFRFRLNLLHAVARAVSSAPLLHAYGIGSIWLIGVEKKIEEFRRGVAKEVSELIKVSTWKLGVNHFAFRELTRRGHKQLAKISKNFQEALSGSVAPVIEGLPAGVGSGNNQTDSDTSALSEITSEINQVSSLLLDGKNPKNQKRRAVMDLRSIITDYLLESSSEGIFDFGSEWLSYLPTVFGADLLTSSCSLLWLRVTELVKNPPVRDLSIEELNKWVSLGGRLMQHRLSVGLTVIEHNQRKALLCYRNQASANSVVYLSEEQISFVRNVSDWIDGLRLIGVQISQMLGGEQGLHVPLFNESIAEDAVIKQLNLSSGSLTISIVTDADWMQTSLLDRINRGLSFLADFKAAHARLWRLLPNLQLHTDLGLQLINSCISQVLSNPPMFTETKDSTDSAPSTNLKELDCLVHAYLLFTNQLLEKGLSIPEEEGPASKEGTTDWTDGTGLGDGEGAKDVSDEIEDYRQFDGVGDQGEGNDKSEGDKGVEVGQDMDVDGEEEGQDRKEGNEEEQQQEEDDTRMGSVEMDKGEVDQDGQKPQNEEDQSEEGKGQDEIRADGEAQGDGDMQAKEGQEGPDQKGTEKGTEKDQSDQSDAEEGEEVDETKEFIDAYLNKQQQGIDEGEEDQNDQESVDGSLGSLSDFDEDEDGDEDGDANDEPDASNEPQNEEEQDGMEVDEPEERGDGESKDENSPETAENMEISNDRVNGDATGEDAPASGMGAGAGTSEKTEQNISEQSQPLNPSASSNGVSSGRADGGAENRGNPSERKTGNGGKSKNKPTPRAPEPNQKEAVEEWLRKVALLGQLDGDEQQEEDGEGQAACQTDDADASKALAESNEQIGAGLAKEQITDDIDTQPDQTDERNACLESSNQLPNAEEPKSDQRQDDSPIEDVTDQMDVKPSKSQRTSRSEAVGSNYGSKVHSSSTMEICSPNDTCEAQKVFVEAGAGNWTSAELRNIISSSEAIAGELSERLRMVLEPTMRGRLQGDYKTGKRIAMRKVLAWIASDYRKDRIWLRRTKPSKRTHRLILTLDNSSSMRSNGSADLSLSATLAIYQALSRLEVGAVGVVSFGSSIRKVRDLNDTEPLTVESLASNFNFDEEASRSFSQGMPSAISAALDMFGFDEERRFSDLCLIVTDGRFDKDAVRSKVQEMLARGQLPVLVIVDATSGNSQNSVYDIKSVVRTSDGKMCVTPFLNPHEFPFPLYAVIQSVTQLPSVLSDLVRQWFETTSS